MWIIAILIFPFVLLWDIMEKENKRHGWFKKPKRRKRKRF